MALRSNDGFATAAYNPLLAPDPPAVLTAVRSDSNIVVSFTPPANVGASAITSYVVEGFIGGVLSTSASGASSPITVTSLTAGSVYTFTVRAVNKYGPSLKSNASASVTSVGSAPYTTAGTYTWVAPSGITSVSVLCVGGGGGGANGRSTNNTGGGGGELRYVNNISVTPGNSYTVVVGTAGVGGATSSIVGPTPTYNVGTAGGQSSFNSTTVRANGGAGGTGATFAAGGSGGTGSGANGGAGGAPNSYGGGGGGGAGSAGTNGITGGQAGNGGAGLVSTITGSPIQYAGGGGGGVNSVPSIGIGAARGGNGGYGATPILPTSATANTGSGGGGGGNAGATSGAAGGSGIVVIRWLQSQQAPASTTGNPQINYADGYQIYTWTSSGTITF